MAKKRSSASSSGSASLARAALPLDLEERLLAVWNQVGQLVEWCDSSDAWLQLFRSEVRPYREAFYWESIAQLIADYTREHPSAKPDRALTACLIATQCPPLPDDRAVLLEFHRMWRATLAASRDAVETAIESDLELARQEGTLEAVTKLYAADRQQWEVPS